MSNSQAIAAVTETLRMLLDKGIPPSSPDDPSADPELSGVTVTARPLDRAHSNSTSLQLNLFLYLTEINAGWRNQDMPRQVKAGEAGRPPLPLNLYYLITAYSPTDDDTIAHRLLGRAMSILHDHPVLDRSVIETVAAGSELHEQLEQVRITPQPLNLEELSKLWTAFQTQYRISAAYKVTVVLIDSTLSPRSPLPVLKQGAEDRGPIAFAEPWPFLHSLYGLWTLPVLPPPDAGDTTRLVRPAAAQPLARLGETITLRGQNLSTIQTVARFSHSLNKKPVELPVQAGDPPQELKIQLPAGNAGELQAWPCGFYTLSLAVLRSGFTWITNEIPFLLAPRIELSWSAAPHGALSLTVTCRPRLRPEQHKRTCLLFGSRQIPPHSVITPSGNPGDEDLPSTLEFRFEVGEDGIGTYTLRLRVDGVDSLPFVVGATQGVLFFDPAQQVTIT